jgi:heme o synthase
MKKNNVKYYFSILLRLMKFRLSILVTFSSAIGFLLSKASPGLNFIWVILGVFLLAGGSSGINQYQEKSYDALMARTSKRPIPGGEINAGLALFLSVFFVLLGFRILLVNGIVPALLGLSNMVVYNLLYTPLKTRSPLSIFPGALVGAIPPVIGWTSAGGDILHPTILFVAIFMFLWQIPHFWLLLIMYGKQYEDAGFSSISKFFNVQQIKYLVFFWTLLTSAFIFLFPLFGINMPALILILLIILNSVFIFFFYKLVFRSTKSKAIRTAFIAINSFMMVVLLIFMLNLLV